MNSESIAAVAQYRTSITTPVRGRFGVADRQSPSRAELEASIKRAFGQHFGAEVRGFMPYLASYLSDEGRGVIGYRPAGDDPLYLESYLELPIESMLSRLTQRQVERDSVVEVGQFAVDDVRVVGQLFAELVPFLREQGFLWICFTATHKIRHLLKRAGLTGLTIATAREDAVRSQADQWGSYYDNDPLVIVGNLEDPSGRWCAPLGNHGRMLAAFGD